MMIELLVWLSGPAYSLGPGDRRDFPQAEAIRLIEAGFGIPVVERGVERPEDGLHPVETRMGQPETSAQRRRGRPRKIG